MVRYIALRLLLAVVAILGVSLIVFVCARLAGDVSYLLAGEGATPQEVMQVRQRLGFDRPVPVQYLLYLGRLLQGDFGYSIRYDRPVIDLILDRYPATVQLAMAAFLLATVVGIALGMVAARYRNRWPDTAISGISVLGQSLPNFWLGIMLIILFAVRLKWFPTSGRFNTLSLVLPTLALAIHSLGPIVRVTRASMLETGNRDFVRFLRAKGMGEKLITIKHVLRNALIPITAMAGLQLSTLLGGTVIIETVFVWPGIGSLMVDAIIQHDYALIQAGAFLTSTILILLNLAIDLLYGVIDPRVRHAG
jgi:peptide/nickel transport system permease protein